MTTCQDVLLYNASRQSNEPFTKVELESLVRRVMQGNSQPASADSSKAKLKSNGITAVSTPEEKVEARVESQLASMSARLSELKDASELKESSSAESALAAKDAADSPVVEKKVDQAKATDHMTDGQPMRESSSRRLLRPPAFESSNVPNGSMVAGK